MAEQGTAQKPLNERLAKVINAGRDKGRLTYDELNNLLPEDVASPEEIDELLTLLGKEHIEIVDKPETENASRLAEREEKEAREEEAQEVAGLLAGNRGLADLLVDRLELTLAEDVEAALLSAGDDEAGGELIPELGRKDDAALLVEFGGVGAKEHGWPSPRSPARIQVCSTLLHFPPPNPRFRASNVCGC